MPDEDGYRLIRKIRALPPQMGGDAPAIALTESDGEQTHGEEGEEPAAEDEHADDVATATISSDDSSSDSLAVVALIVGALGLLVGGYAVMSSRRAS
jgi:CheY-like chemotaxis protein